MHYISLASATIQTVFFNFAALHGAIFETFYAWDRQRCGMRAPPPLDFGSRIVGDKGALIYLDCVGGVE